MPKPEVLYTKTYHFMDESLLEKEKRRQRKQQRREEREKKAKEEEATKDDEKSKLQKPILLNNQKDQLHDRSLSKVRDIFGERTNEQ